MKLYVFVIKLDFGSFKLLIGELKNAADHLKQSGVAFYCELKFIYFWLTACIEHFHENIAIIPALKWTPLPKTFLILSVDYLPQQYQPAYSFLWSFFFFRELRQSLLKGEFIDC